MSPNITIGAAAESQASVLASLLGLLFAQEREFCADPARQTAGLSALFAHPELGSVQVALDDGQPVGMVVVLFSVSTALGGPVATLEDLVVLPEWRGQGVGSALIGAALTVARARGCLRVSLLTDDDNHRAQALYARHGFVRSSMQLLRLMVAGEGEGEGEAAHHD